MATVSLVQLGLEPMTWGLIVGRWYHKKRLAIQHTTAPIVARRV
jgi:hypothetical protein